MRQKLGQHFLKDEDVLDKTIEYYNSVSDEIIVEVGPGEGALTDKLLQLKHKVVAIEWDEALYSYLRAKYSDNSSVEIINADIRHFDLVKYLIDKKNTKYSVIANLPYYLSSYFIRQLFEYQVLPRSAIILIQKEVAERLTAKSGSKTRSVISVLAQIYSQPEIKFVVPATAFNPPPEVESAIIKFDNIANPFDSIEQRKLFFRVIKAGFSSKRKTILNSLSAGLAMSREVVEIILNNVCIKTDLRAEDLTNEEWFKIVAELRRSA